MQKLLIVSLFFCISFLGQAEEAKTLSIGSKAPDFFLKGVDGKMYSLNSFSSARILVIVFTCNHCPTAQAYEDRIIKFTADYKPKGVQVVAINPNFAEAIRFDELGYTDMGDTYTEMQQRAKDRNFNFPYLDDGQTQEVTQKYGPTTTPHVFVFDKNRLLQYVGRIDDNEHSGKEKIFDLRNATDALLANKTPSPTTTKTFGCSIKWASKVEWKTKEKENWTKELVELKKADITTLKILMGNKSDNYRLINVWATWCGPCVSEFSSLIETDKMYRGRNFELITISADDEASEEKVTTFLKKKWASNKNYLFVGGSKYDLIEAIDPNWQGALPYTVLIAPNGEIVYNQMGIIEPLELRKAIVSKIGRVYP